MYYHHYYHKKKLFSLKVLVNFLKITGLMGKRDKMLTKIRLRSLNVLVHLNNSTTP